MLETARVSSATPRMPRRRFARSAARALGRVQEERFLPVLERMSGDRSARVRDEAIFALGQDWGAAGERSLLRVAARAGLDRKGRVRSLEGLGKCAAWQGAGYRVVVDALAHARPEVRAQAALALGLMAWRQHRTRPKWDAATPPLALLVPMLRDSSDAVVRAATYALFRLTWTSAPRSAPIPVVGWRLEALEALRQVSGHRLAEVRMLATQGIGFLLAATGGPAPAETLARFADADWRVRVTAAEAAGRIRQADLEARLVGLLADGSPMVRVAALRALVSRKATGAAERVRALEAESGQPAQVRGEALVTLAALAPVLGVPVLESATGDASANRRRDAARGWARLQGDSEKGRAERAWECLSTLSRDCSPRVREAALEGLAGTTFHRAEVVRLLTARLEDPDVVVRAVAGDSLGQLKAREAAPAIVAALRKLSEATDLEVLLTMVEALGNLGNRSALPALDGLRRSPHRTLAVAAASAMSTLGGRKVQAAPGKSRAPQVPAEALAFVARASRLEAEGRPVVVTLITEEGPLVVRLQVREAPLTCWNLVRLARAKYFDGLTFHRVVPNFVAQGGDPRGDGWGGPGRTMRCETNPLVYERGAMGMALAGKDTGGSQFFLAHSWQPHLDGHYTIFGTLVRGGEVLDRLVEGSRIRIVEVKCP